MDPHRSFPLALDLLRALETVPQDGREGWLRPMLRSLRDAAGATFACLGESTGQGWVRHVLAGDTLLMRAEPRLLGLSQRLATGEGSILEPALRRGSLYRARTDGWEGIEAAGFAGVPLEGRARGWISIVRTSSEPPFREESISLLRLAARAASTALANETRLRSLEALAMTDELTQIPNYRYLRQGVDAEIARALRRDEFFTVVMVDVDNLKVYNGVHGHLGGSELLRELARLLRDNIRRSDVAGKYGGDEFLLILPRTRPDGGKMLCERIRKHIAERLRGRGGEPVSCSFGVAGFPEDGVDYESLIRAADRALFNAKSGGRNAVVCVATESNGARDARAAVPDTDARAAGASRRDSRAEDSEESRAA